MPLDAVAQQYAKTLYLARLQELSKKYSTRTAETAAALAKRGILAHTAGQFHTEMARIEIERIDELTDARVDALLTAYERAKVPIDNEAVAEINRAAAEVFGTQGKYLIANARGRASSSNSPSGVAESLTGMIESAMSQIKSRINYKLSALRDEATLAARSTPQNERFVPKPDLAEIVAKPDAHKWTRGEKWTAVGAIATIAALIIALLAFLHLDKRSVSPPNNPSYPEKPAPQANNPSHPEKPAPKPLQVITTKDAVELRGLDQVERIRDEESGKTLSEIPPGSFGFTQALEVVWQAQDLHEQIKLESYGFPQEFEIHKLRDGSALLVVYLGPETLDRLREGLQPRESVSLYSTSWKDAPNIAAIPIDQISCARDREFSTKDGKKYKNLYVLDCQPK